MRDELPNAEAAAVPKGKELNILINRNVWNVLTFPIDRSVSSFACFICCEDNAEELGLLKGYSDSNPCLSLGNLSEIENTVLCVTHTPAKIHNTGDIPPLLNSSVIFREIERR